MVEAVRIGLDEARQYFAHPSQHAFGLTEADLPENAAYYADGDVCGAFQGVLWPGIVAAHIGVKPDACGMTFEPALRILVEFSGEFPDMSIIGIIGKDNRLAVSQAKKLGFETKAIIGPIELMEWRR